MFCSSIGIGIGNGNIIWVLYEILIGIGNGNVICFCNYNITVVGVTGVFGYGLVTGILYGFGIDNGMCWSREYYSLLLI